MEKIKILYVLTKSDVGGAQKYVSDLIDRLDKNRFDAKALYGGKDLRWLSNEVRPLFLFANDWLAIREIMKIFAEEKPDIVHLNSSKAGVLGSLAAFLHNLKNGNGQAGIKVIFTAHGWVFNPTNRLNPLLRIFYIALHKLSAYFQDEIICVSEYDYQLAMQYGIKPRIKIHAIHNGIDANLKFLSRKEARNAIINKLPITNCSPDGGSPEGRQLSNNSVWVGSIGRVVKEKNYETFVEAAAEIAKEKKTAKTGLSPYFFLIGEGPELRRLKAESEKLKIDDRLFFIGPSGDDAKYLKAFDIFVMSSIKEGLPYILLEAMAAGLPIVVTEAGGIPEIIKNHQNGMMVSQKNPKQLAQAISGLLANASIAEELGKSAKTAVTEHFNIRKMIEKTEASYEILFSKN